MQAWSNDWNQVNINDIITGEKKSFGEKFKTSAENS